MPSAPTAIAQSFWVGSFHPGPMALQGSAPAADVMPDTESAFHPSLVALEDHHEAVPEPVINIFEPVIPLGEFVAGAAVVAELLS